MNKQDKRKVNEMSSRERRELRRTEEATARGEYVMTDAEYAERKRRVRIFATAAIIVAVLLIAAGVVIPCAMAANYMFERNPVAVFTFEAGGETYKVEYEIYAEDCPNAANNFMYLASIGFFDGVIVFDTQESQVRFGGYTDPTYDEEKGEWDYEHRSDDLWFASKLKDDFDPDRYEDGDDPDIFKYRIKADKNGIDYTDAELLLCANVGSGALSATEFQFSCSRSSDAANLMPEPGSRGDAKRLELEGFGAPLHEDEAREIFGVILSLPKYESSEGEAEYARGYFRAPKQTVTLKSVKMYNYDAAWLDSKYEYGFESYMSEIGAFVSTGTWSKNYL